MSWRCACALRMLAGGVVGIGVAVGCGVLGTCQMLIGELGPHAVMEHRGSDRWRVAWAAWKAARSRSMPASYVAVGVVPGAAMAAPARQGGPETCAAVGKW